MPLKTILLLGVVLLVGLFWFNQRESHEPFTPATLPASELRAHMSRSIDLSDHPCMGRTRCLVVYLAPWCGACRQTKQFVPFVREVIAEHGDVGFMVVVGRKRELYVINLMQMEQMCHELFKCRLLE